MVGVSEKLHPDRSKINVQDKFELQHWLKHFKISEEDLQKAVDKVGNSAAAVRKQLGRNKSKPEQDLQLSTSELSTPARS